MSLSKKIQVTAMLFAVSVLATLYLYFKDKPPPTHLADLTLPFIFGRFQIPVDNPLTAESIILGRRLFYDPRLSSTNKVSCATCHKQHLAFTDGLKHSVGVSGRPLKFNTMSLSNLMWGPRHFFWNGRSASLENQALQPIQHIDEMGQNLDQLVDELRQDNTYPILFKQAYGRINIPAIAKALANFQRTLISSNSRYDQYLRGEITLNTNEELGRKLFMAHPDTKASLRGGNCIDCHSQFLTSGFSTFFDGFSNNGLSNDDNLPPALFEVTGKEQHRGLFKTPTLRNIALTAPYMHDGRFETLQQVLKHYNGGIKRSKTLSPLILEADNISKAQKDHISLNLDDDEEKAIIAFLHTLTDEDFLSNPMFSDPFKSEQVNE